jgi:DNA-binding HxlR family transcriptional regulator
MLDLMEKKWALRIIREIYGGHVRFNDLKRSLKGITAAVLSKRLKELEKKGFVSKTTYKAGAGEIKYTIDDGAKHLMDCWDIHKQN